MSLVFFEKCLGTEAKTKRNAVLNALTVQTLAEFENYKEDNGSGRLF